MTTKARIAAGDGDPRHGTANGYCNLKCRCDECRKAWAAYHREYMNADPDRAFRSRLADRLRYTARRERTADA